MGASSAKAEINSSVEYALAQINNNNQNCTQRSNFQNGVTISCGSIIGNTINVDATDYVSLDCLQNINISDTVQTNIINNFKNSAASAVQALGAGYADATAIVNTSVGLAVSLTNNTIQNCVTGDNTSNYVVLTCTGSGGEALNNVININENAQAISSCVQSAAESSNVNANVDQTIDNAASATVGGLFGPLIFLIIIIIIAVAVFFVADFKWVVILTIAILIIALIYVIIAYELKWFPFQKQK